MPSSIACIDSEQSIAKRITSLRDSVYCNLESGSLPPQLGQKLQWHTAGLHHLRHLENPNDRLPYVVIAGLGRVSVRLTLMGFTLSVHVRRGSAFYIILATILRRGCARPLNTLHSVSFPSMVSGGPGWTQNSF